MTTHSQRAMILYRRRRFINHLLTYLLTYLALRCLLTWQWSLDSAETRFLLVLLADYV